MSGGFDVAGVDGSLSPTWTNLSPPLPDVEGLGNALDYDYKREFYEISGRFYTVFASGSTSLARTVYCYSWAAGEVAWTLEFSTPLGASGAAPSWDAACDGAHVYVGWTEGASVHTPCPPPAGGTGKFSAVLVSKGVHGAAWTPVGTIFSHSFDLMPTGVSTPMYFVMCASASEPGNVYVASIDGGITNGAVLACGFSETFSVHGLGVSPSIGEVVIVELDFFPGPSDVYDNPVVDNFYLVNDTDQVQLFYRPPGDTGIEEHQVNIVKPTLSATPVQVIATFAGESFAISPAWTDNATRVERALFAGFDGTGDNLRAVAGDGLSIRNLLGYAPLSASGVPVPAAFITGNSFQPVGFYYDPVKDEYWCIYTDNSGNLRSAVTTIDCAPLRWQPETWDSGADVAIVAGQGPRPDPESFYTLATHNILTTMPSITVLPICRSCVPCPDFTGPVFRHHHKAAT